MIAQLRGTVVSLEPMELVLDVNGVGYLLAIPMSTYDEIVRKPAGEVITIRTTMAVREDAIQLYGFARKQEQMIFELLCTVQGIGAKTALNILSSMNIPGFCSALVNGDVKSLKRINGVGPKSAERMVVELRDKINKLMPEFAFAAPENAPGFQSKAMDDALLALEQLGFQKARIQKTVADLVMALPEEQRSVENIIRKSLQTLNK